PTAPPALYTLSLHDALPIFPPAQAPGTEAVAQTADRDDAQEPAASSSSRQQPGGRDQRAFPTGTARHHGDPAERETRAAHDGQRSEEHTSELQSRENLVCRL